MNAVYLEAGNTTLLGAPTAPFDAIELDQALREDAPGWMNAIFEEFLAHKRINTYIIMRGRVLVGRSLLLSRLILRHKFNGKGVVICKKARLCIPETSRLLTSIILRHLRLSYDMTLLGS
jgi:hypothetical protein